MLCAVLDAVNWLKSRKRRLTAGILAVLFLIWAVSVAVLAGPRPICHRAVDGAFQEWMHEAGHTNAYPNADGIGSNSLAMIERYSGKEIQRYEYVPGLTCGDPKDLVLMYLKTKTRYSYHGDTEHTIFSPLRWMVLSPDILDGTCPEGGQLLETAELKRRVQMTVAFLKEHQRLHWQAVAKEQSEFLSSIKE